MSWNEQLPEWNNQGAEPPAQKKTDGWQPEERPPAGWWNWLLNRTYKALQEIRNKIDNMTGMEVHGNEYHDPDFATKAEHDAHLADTMPHRFTSGGTTYRWGLAIINGVVNMVYEEHSCNH